MVEGLVEPRELVELGLAEAFTRQPQRSETGAYRSSDEEREIAMSDPRSGSVRGEDDMDRGAWPAEET